MLITMKVDSIDGDRVRVTFDSALGRPYHVTLCANDIVEVKSSMSVYRRDNFVVVNDYRRDNNLNAIT